MLVFLALITLNKLKIGKIQIYFYTIFFHLDELTYIEIFLKFSIAENLNTLYQPYNPARTHKASTIRMTGHSTCAISSVRSSGHIAQLSMRRNAKLSTH